MSFAEIVVLLQRCYAQAVPLREVKVLIRDLLNDAALRQMATLEGQGTISKVSFAHSVHLSYPERTEYRVRFLSWFVGLVEPFLLEDGLADDVTSAISEDLRDTRACVRGAWTKYFTGHDYCYAEALVIREDPSLVVDGRTGLRVWGGALILAEWLLAKPLDLREKRVLELGCGTGFLGLITGVKALGAATVALTDCDSNVLERALENASANINRGVIPSSCKVTVTHLDWTSSKEVIASHDPYDVILASDIAYDPEVLTAFSQTVWLLLKKSSSSTCIVATTVRRPETFSRFLEALTSYNLKWTQIDFERPKPLFIQPEPGDVRILELAIKEDKSCLSQSLG